jgi:hypothetical protein
MASQAILNAFSTLLTLLRQFDAKKATVENDVKLTKWVNDLTEEENTARIGGEDDDNTTGDKH